MRQNDRKLLETRSQNCVATAIPALKIPARLTRFQRVEYNSIHWSVTA